jgi:carbon-monoxide dehydrogenase medium subunit
MQPFSVFRPTSVDEVTAYLAADPEAKPLAGGHSLIPVMKQGLSAPTALVDLSNVAALRGIAAEADLLRIGAMVRHEEIGSSAKVAAHIPALSALACGIGDPHVRHRGTLGGSLATNDPGADYPAAALALEAVFETTKRRIEAQAYFQGWYSTSLEHDELILAVEFPIPEWADYQSMRHPASGLALAGVFVARFGQRVRVSVTGAGANGVFRAEAFEAALQSRFQPDSIEGTELEADEMAGDIHAGPAYRAALVKALLRRSVEKYHATKRLVPPANFGGKT